MKESAFHRSRNNLVLALALLPIFLVFDIKGESIRAIPGTGDGLPAQLPAVEGAGENDKTIGNKPSLPADDGQPRSDMRHPPRKEAGGAAPSAAEQDGRQSRSFIRDALGCVKGIGEPESDFLESPLVRGLISFGQKIKDVEIDHRCDALCDRLLSLGSMAEEQDGELDSLIALLAWSLLLIITVTIWLLNMIFPRVAQRPASTGRMKASPSPASAMQGESLQDIRNRRFDRFKLLARIRFAGLVYTVLPFLALSSHRWDNFVLMAIFALIPVGMLLREFTDGNDDDGEGNETGSPMEATPEADRDQRPEEKNGGRFEKILGFVLLACLIAMIVIVCCYGWLALLKTLGVGIWLMIGLGLLFSGRPDMDR